MCLVVEDRSDKLLFAIDIPLSIRSQAFFTYLAGQPLRMPIPHISVTLTNAAAFPASGSDATAAADRASRVGERSRGSGVPEEERLPRLG